MDEITHAINVSKSVSEFGVLVVTAAAFVIAAIGLQAFFSKTTKKLINDIITTQQTMLKEILELLRGQNAGIGELKEALTGEILNQIRIVSNYAFDYNKYQVLMAIAQIKEGNNLENIQTVERKLKMILNNLYNKRNSDFDAFAYNGKKLSYYTNPEWSEHIYKFCIDAIYDGNAYNRDKYLHNLNIFYEEVKIEFFDNLKRKN
jgi:hypothetical protein